MKKTSNIYKGCTDLIIYVDGNIFRLIIEWVYTHKHTYIHFKTLKNIYSLFCGIYFRQQLYLYIKLSLRVYLYYHYFYINVQDLIFMKYNGSIENNATITILYQCHLAHHWRLDYPPVTSSGPPHWVWGMALMVGLPLFSLLIFWSHQSFLLLKKINVRHSNVFQNSIIFYITVIRLKIQNIFWNIC